MKLTSIFLLWVLIYTTFINNISLSNDFGIIPENLKKNADAIIRYDHSEFKIISQEKATYKVNYAVTILNKSGDKFANCYVIYDKFKKIKELSGKIYNGDGELILKLKTKDFSDQSLNSNSTLYDDNRLKYYKPLQKKYPYTVEYTYILDFDGFIHFPKWQPISSYNIAIESSDYKLSIKKGYSFHFKEVNIQKDYKKTESEEYVNYFWQIEDKEAVSYEPFDPYLSEFTPTVYFAPNQFYYDGHAGSQDSWQNLGKWAYYLTLNRGELSEKTKEEIDVLLKDIENPIDKAKVLYEYMQSKTRYVSIQLGIGGFQPFSAMEVDLQGYGDCKALSNYMVSLLNYAGIKSYYALVGAGRNQKETFVNFSSVNQMNHVIVCLPLNNDTIWLECTDQEQPFGFLGSFTDDRYALILTEEGGKLVKTSKYELSDNLQYRVVDAIVHSDGSLESSINTKYRALQFDNISSQFNKSVEDQRKTLYKELDLVNFEIKHFEYSQNKDIIPSATEKIEVLTKNYTSIVGERMFITLNLLNKSTYIPKKADERKSDIVLTFAYYDIDSINYKIPDKYRVEYLPDSTHIISPFGEYKSYAIVENDTIKYVRHIKKNEGRFPKEKYSELIDFYKEIKEADRLTAILIEKNN